MSGQDRDSVDRRQFLKTAALGGAAMTAGIASAARHSTSETLVAQLYQSLSAEQKSKVAFAFDDPLRSKVDNNWHITPVRIKDFFSPDQQAMIAEIFRGLHNPEFVDKVLYHIRDDAGGLGEYAVALFGEPGTGAFEFVLTGRHCTVRCDGDSVEGAAFGGPIFYGHAAGSFNESADHPNNVYWYQAVRANEVFQALDGKQRAAALLGEARAEKATATVRLGGSRDDLAGLPVSEMSADQHSPARLRAGTPQAELSVSAPLIGAAQRGGVSHQEEDEFGGERCDGHGCGQRRWQGGGDRAFAGGVFAGVGRAAGGAAREHRSRDRGRRAAGVGRVCGCGRPGGGV
jgi:hypothetical protein